MGYKDVTDDWLCLYRESQEAQFVWNPVEVIQLEVNWPLFCIIQEIYKDRKKFSRAVFEVASSDLVNMGISVVSYTLKDLKDDEVSWWDYN